MMKAIIVLSLFFVVAHANAQMYRCEEQGRITYSDFPCPPSANSKKIEVPSVLENATRPPPPVVAPPENESAERIAKRQRIREIDEDIAVKQAEIQGNLDAMYRETAKLQEESAKIGDNKLNALWKQSLAEEMRAVSAKYRMANDTLQKQIEQMLAEKQLLMQ